MLTLKEVMKYKFTSCNCEMELPLYGLRFSAYRLGNILEDTAAASLALVGHQLHPVLPLLLRLLGKVGGEPWQGLVVS